MTQRFNRETVYQVKKNLLGSPLPMKKNFRFEKTQSVSFPKIVVSYTPCICSVYLLNMYKMLCTINKSPFNEYCIDLDNINLFLVFILFRQMTKMMMMIVSTKPPTPVLNPIVNWSPSDSLINSLATINSILYELLTL